MGVDGRLRESRILDDVRSTELGKDVVAEICRKVVFTTLS